MCHEDFVFYNQADTPRRGIEGFLAAEKKNLDAFEGYSTVIETIAEGDNVVAYIVFEGDQSGEIFGIPPKGAHLRMSMCNLFRIKDGKFIEKRAHFDRLDHIEQLNKAHRSNAFTSGPPGTAGNRSSLSAAPAAVRQPHGALTTP